jgi:hypothetical protein
VGGVNTKSSSLFFLNFAIFSLAAAVFFWEKLAPQHPQDPSLTVQKSKKFVHLKIIGIENDDCSFVADHLFCRFFYLRIPAAGWIYLYFFTFARGVKIHTHTHARA